MTEEREQAEARVGTVLNDKWTLERLLGVGGMAAVYEGRHRNEARAALKILHASVGQHPSIRERFVHEGYAANRVEHPDVVKVLDDDVIQGGPEDGTPFLVMELLSGRSLEERVRSGPRVGEVELLEILLAVLSVLQAAHAKGIVHRDLKPENLFLVGEDPPKVKVLDFGIARTTESRGLTIHGLPMGTPAFMAPEQAAGRVNEIDGRTDLFALGATGFNVLSGNTVHQGENTLDVMNKMAKEQAPSLRSVYSKASEPMARVIDRALMLHREDRYPSAEAMREDVALAMRELRPPPAVSDGATTPPLPVVDPSRDPQPARSGGCAPIVVLLLLVAGVLAVGFWRWGWRLPTSSAPGPTPVTDAALAPVSQDAATADLVQDAATPAPEVAAEDGSAALDAAETDADSTSEMDASVEVNDAAPTLTKPVTSVARPHPTAPVHPRPRPKPHH